MPAATVRSTVLRIPAADLGPESPLPSFTGLQRLADASGSPGLPDEMRERIAYGRLANPLPYPLHNGYRRDLTPSEIPAFELTNGRLQALMLPTLGGRVWSLRDLDTGRDLVFRNPRLQFANLGLTDAWFAGGIEWNLGSTGHAATSTRPVFTGTVATERGTVLRLWEWERTRDLVFSVDLLMPADRSLLLVFVRIQNPDPHPKPLYWWSNIAVPQEPGVRVLAPAQRAWRTDHDGLIARVDVPHPDDPEVDVSYPEQTGRSVDYFFEVPPEQRPWIAAVRADGSGLLQTSTAELRGRKLFCWGTATGGRRWQEWLCGPDSAYLEIQAGLATTQLEHRRLDGDAELSWVEAYGPLDLDPARTTAAWTDAAAHVDARLDDVVSGPELDDWRRWWRAEVADATPAQLAAGSGAGRAELLVRERDASVLPGTPFGRPRDDGFRRLVALVRSGSVDQNSAGGEVLVPPTTARWAPYFAGPDGWWSALMRAVRAQAGGDLDTAETCYRRSAGLRPTAWATRGLATVALARGDVATAAELYRHAVAEAPDSLPLLVEATTALLDAGRAADGLAVLDAAPAELRDHGRVLLQRVRALLATGRADEARATLTAGFEIPDLREGETLGEVWATAFGDAPLPRRYDFRMRPDREG